MEIKRGHAGGWYVVFADEGQAQHWEFLFRCLLKRSWCCFNGYYNAFHLFGSK